MTAALAASWSATMRYAREAADHFWCAVEDRCPGTLPEREAAVFLAAFGRLVSGGDDPAGRAALSAVLGRACRRYRLLPHLLTVEAALVATVSRHARWTPELAGAWVGAARRATAAVSRAAEQAGDGPPWWPAQVVDHDRAADGIAVVTARPWRRLAFRPGQALPVCTERRPGRWRWYSPANAPRPDGTVELHVRAVAAVSRTLVHRVRPGDRIWLGPPRSIGLTLDPASNADLLLVAGGTGLAPLRALVEQVAALGRRGYRTDDVDALLHRLVYELGERTRLLDDTRGENDRIKRALRAWQAEVREADGARAPEAVPDSPSRPGPDGRRAAVR
ncbi:FAD-binding oxidoreductase [Micromonospora aurantiaca (nom. illeg.)]|uniref:FAD-binding oxidoreductase n=1 Tax=Micromonospora aurantiaca (nom. illeg.) TaxID=47850 RepID=UPI0033E9FA1A